MQYHQRFEGLYFYGNRFRKHLIRLIQVTYFYGVDDGFFRVASRC
jgi:hypothetical protein